jgi:hypothetical protein
MKSTSSSGILGSFLRHVLHVGSGFSVPRAPGGPVGPDRHTAGGGWSIVSLLPPVGNCAQHRTSRITRLGHHDAAAMGIEVRPGTSTVLGRLPSPPRSDPAASGPTIFAGLPGRPCSARRRGQPDECGRPMRATHRGKGSSVILLPAIHPTAERHELRNDHLPH